MMPSVTELTYFFEVANTKILTRAVKKLRISQPSLSRAIQNLETSVGTELFIRHQKGVVLTLAGKKILLQLKPLLACWQNLKLEARSSHQNVKGHIRIGCHTTVGLFIHKILLALLEKYPQLDIEIYNSASETITQQVIDLNIDIGIVINPIQHPDLIMRKIAQTETTLWVGLEKRKIQNIHSDEAVIICNPDFRHTQLIFKKFKNANFKFKRILKVSSVEVIASLTANGCGIGVLPSSFIQNLYAGRLQRLPKAPVVADELYLIYRKEYINVEVFKMVVSIIKAWSQL